MLGTQHFIKQRAQTIMVGCRPDVTRRASRLVLALLSQSRKVHHIRTVQAGLATEFPQAGFVVLILAP